MAIRTFKEIIDNKAYRISSKDRAIFEQGTLQSFFGFSDHDMVEFILYDVNDNQLPQGDAQVMVRYLTLNSDNIRDYFLIPTGTVLKPFEFPEYFVDVERLIKEAGYSNGIFKTQITLLNKRVGFENEDEKLWINEISPSRREVKLLPLINEASKETDLEERFQVMVDGGEFRDDIISFVPAIIESITVDSVKDYILSEYPDWYVTFLIDFNISDFQNLCRLVYEKFLEAVKFEFSNCTSDINDINYGKTRRDPPPLKLSKEEVKDIVKRILEQCIDKYLPERNKRDTTDIELKTIDRSDQLDIDEGEETTEEVITEDIDEIPDIPSPPKTSPTRTDSFNRPTRN